MPAPLWFWEEAFRSPGLTHSYCALGAAIVRGCYHQILRPHGHFAKFGHAFCRHANVTVNLNLHPGRQAAKRYL
jgi:hypothetical protein